MDQDCVQQCSGFAHFSGSPGLAEGQLGVGARGGLAAALRSCLDEQVAHLLCPQSPAHQRQRAPTAKSLLGEKRRKGLFVFSLRDPVLWMAQQQEELFRASPGSTAGVTIPLVLCSGLGEKLGKLPLCWLW